MGENSVPLHQLFERQVNARPTATAVTFNGESISYGELNARANRLAHYLQERGVARESLIGLCLDRGFDTIIAILAVLKAGAAYIPIEPLYPAERVRSILEDAECPLVIIHKGHRALVAAAPSENQVVLDGDNRPWEASSPANTESGTTGASLAYVIYTSGSTGKPKGAMITHHNVYRLFAQTASWFTFSEADVWTLFHSYAFDFSVWEIWGALLYGGRLVIVPFLVSRAPEEFHALMIAERVTVLNQTPSAFGQLQLYDESLALEESRRHSLRLIIFGGEALALPSLRPWFLRHGDSSPRLVNMYGITETTVHVTYRPLCMADTEPGTPNFIGIPIPDLTLYVLDELQNPVKTGEVGELYVGGDGVGRGYLRRPELSAERFIRDPLASNGNSGTFYKTGDIVRLHDGELEYLGRNDNQVQLRGFRIELGEIESVLNAHPAVRGCIVRIREDAPGEQRLIAYYLAGEARLVRELRAHIAKALPSYMVPAALVQLDKFPLNSSGKIDCEALPMPVVGSENYIAPEPGTQAEVAAIWQELLRIPEVGLYDNFFELGGHSLLATRILVHIHAHFGVVIPLRALYDSPTVFDLARTIDLALQANPEFRDSRLPLADRSRPIPLAFSQEQLWILAQFDSGLSAYNISLKIDIRGTLRREDVCDALTDIVWRHEILRTVFVDTNGCPEQRILPLAPVPLGFQSLMDVSHTEMERILAGRILDMAKQPMNLAEGPLFRANLFQLSPEHHCLSIVVHHIIFDGWSVSVLLDELADELHGRATGIRGQRAELPYQFVDFTEWQRVNASTEAAQADLAYWKKQLLGPLPALQMPLDFPRPDIQSWDGARACHELNLEVMRHVESLALALQVTPFVVLLAGWKALLFRYTGQEDLITGTALGGRSRREWESLIGFFVHTVALRTTLSRDLPFQRLVERVQEVMLEAQAHQHVPFEQVVAHVQRERDPGRSPVFQAMVVLHNTPEYRVEREGLLLTAEELDNGGAKFDLTLAIVPMQNSLKLVLEYNVALFKAETAALLLERFDALLQDALQTPDRSIGRLNLAGSHAPAESIGKDNGQQHIAVPLHEGPCLHHVFERHALTTPDAPAVACEGSVLTYGTLNAQANRLAHYLRQCGVVPEQRVALCLDRGIDMIVAILAVLKAGGAYVPIDPTSPSERVQLIAQDAQCAVVIVHALYERHFSASAARTIILDGFTRPWDEASASNPVCVTTKRNLAYVIYTSGSTGKPKGALISHWNVYRLLTEMDPWFKFDRDDVWTLFHSYAFDFSVWEMWGAFYHGGRLVVVSHLVSRSPDAFYKLLLDEGVTVLNQTPSAFKQLQYYDSTVPREMAHNLSLRYVIFGGETLDLPGLSGWFERHGDEKPSLVNMYGITETTVFVTYRPVSKTDTRPGTPNCIGIPIPDLTLYILDEHQLPVKPGVVGELYVGGDGVGLGYLDRPELTRERFIANLPAAQGKTGTVYKTGDLVRALDGDMEFIGRNDMQVQLRGFRVELGEIEVTMNAIPAVRSSVVRMREDVPGDQRLVAYYLAEEAIPIATLRTALEQSLPTYMVPAHFEHMDKFPLNQNGKIDVGALPVPGGLAQSEKTTARPLTPIEERLVAIWKPLLRIQDIGLEENFFALGGHSLLAIQVLNRIQREYGAALPLRSFYESPTVADLAKAVTAWSTTGGSGAFARANRDAPIPLSFSQEQLWIIEQLAIGNAAYGIPVFFEIKGVLNATLLQKALQAVVERHEPLRTVFSSRLGNPVQVIMESLVVPFEVVNTESGFGIAEEQVRRRIVQAARESMDLESGPLLKALYFPAGEGGTSYLGMVVHHAVFDGWSIRILLDELTSFYNALAAGQHATLPVLEYQYADYSAWQRERATSEDFNDKLTYWKQQLAGPLPILEFPTDFPRPPHQTWEGGLVEQELARVLSNGLEELASSSDTTLFVVLMAAWNVLLYRYTGQNDILVGTVVAGRNHPAVEIMIGCFVNTVVLRTRITEGQTFLELVEAVNENVIAAQENEAVPFEQVVAAVQHERDPSRSPIVQVLFTHQNTPRCTTEIAGCRATAEEIGNGGAKFDLSLFVNRKDDTFALGLEFNTALFRESSAARILSEFTTLLASVLSKPTAPVDELDILDASAKRLMLETWNDTEAPLDRSLALNRAFMDCANAHADQIAVTDDETSMTYRELDEASNRVANFLLEKGIVREEPVPFFLSRSVRVVVVILGIVKAGAAFVPLDLLDPPARRERVLAVLCPRILLTEADLLPQLSGTAASICCLDEASALRSVSAHDPGIALKGDDLAYIFFTSGSTGDPKGVSCTHQGVINLYQDLQSRCAVGPGDHCSLWTAFSFDISVYESWTSLLAGATLHIIPERVRTNPEQCLQWLRERNITTGYIQGFMLPALLELQRRDPIPLRRLLVGLEPLPETLLCDILASTPDMTLLNWYGPTEAAIYCTLYEVHEQQPRPIGNAPIGKPIQNMRAYVLDPARNLLPIGVPGELYLGGVGLARGYYNDPDLTARQFIPDPFTQCDSGRLYRTGDLVYLRPDGNIQFLRRMGRYIKLRGYRIEPGEIESVLRTHPSVSDAVVALHGEGTGLERLIAYLVAAQGGAVDTANLAEFIKGQLPAYMCPAQFVVLDAFPRTVQGKLDRKALPAPSDPSTFVDETPLTECERSLVALWKTLFDCPEIGRNDDFFALGGHSLLAIQLMTSVNSHFLRTLTLDAFFLDPTVRGLARLLEASPDEASQWVAGANEILQLVAPRDRGKNPFFFVSGATDVRNAFGPLARLLNSNQPMYGFSEALLWREDNTVPPVETLAAAAIRELQSVKPHGPYVIGGFSFGGVVAYEMAHQLIEAGEDIAGLILLDSTSYFGQSDDPNFRCQSVHLFFRKAVLIAWKFVVTWKIQTGYVRDGARLLLRRLLRLDQARDDEPTLRGYLRWIWQDTNNQYDFIRAGIAKVSVSDRRLEMARDAWLRQRTRGLSMILKAQEQYVLKPLPVRIELLRVDFNPMEPGPKDTTLGWARFAEKGVHVEIVPGNHIVMYREPFVKHLAAALQRALDRSN